jgi:hypothetical protein
VSTASCEEGRRNECQRRDNEERVPRSKAHHTDSIVLFRGAEPRG